MINFDSTINTAFYKQFNRLRYLADNNTLAFKKIMYAVVLKDMLLWAKDRNEPQETQHRLQNLLTKFLMNNCEFPLIMVPELETPIHYYTAVKL